MTIHCKTVGQFFTVVLFVLTILDNEMVKANSKIRLMVSGARLMEVMSFTRKKLK